MKLKLYRISLIIMLLISCAFTIYLGIKVTLNVLEFEQSKLSDGIIYILCFVLLLLFTVLEITNTIISFKNGSVYIKGLAYDDNNNVNRNSLIVAGGIALLSIFAIIYMSLILGGRNLPLYTLEKEAQYVILATLILALINAVYIVLFPLLATEDQSLKNE